MGPLPDNKAYAVASRVVVTLGLTPAALSASRRERILTWALLGGGGGGAWLAAAVLQAPQFFWIGLVLMVLAIPVYLFGARLVRVTRLLDGDRVWIRGLHPAYLARLPELRD